MEPVLLVSAMSHAKSPSSQCDSACSMSLTTMPAYSLSGRCWLCAARFIGAYLKRTTVLFLAMMSHWLSLCLMVSPVLLFVFPCVRSTTTTSV